MRLFRGVVLVLAVFVGIGNAVDRAVLYHAHNPATPKAQVRMSAAMAGLFAGGAAASVVTLIVAFKRNG